MSREDLAKRLRTTRMRIWRLENGVTEVSAEVLQRIADELGTRVENFYRESGAS